MSLPPERCPVRCPNTSLGVPPILCTFEVDHEGACSFTRMTPRTGCSRCQVGIQEKGTFECVVRPCSCMCHVVERAQREDGLDPRATAFVREMFAKNWSFISCEVELTKLLRSVATEAFTPSVAGEDAVLHVIRSDDVEGTLVKLLVRRLHGNVSFTEQDLQRAKQLDVKVRWDGHRYTLTAAWP